MRKRTPETPLPSPMSAPAVVAATSPPAPAAAAAPSAGAAAAGSGDQDAEFETGESFSIPHTLLQDVLWAWNLCRQAHTSGFKL
jgi:hypothetical protein